GGGQDEGQTGARMGGRADARAAGPLYVLSTDALANTVTVGSHEELRAQRVPVRQVTLHRPGARVDRVKLRYRSRALPCQLPGDLEPGLHARAEVALDEPVYGAAPGQLACLMEGELVIGYGTIAR
ncbi:MAG TPA: aminomethyltransferase beta-barrel domain-containing protein, partial [Solirubrobacteraceae bacterium]|nr:aminomethyltransferase beta-barrel domain-containing protein [Solirubrobacteraceae bacterium]